MAYREHDHFHSRLRALAAAEARPGNWKVVEVTFYETDCLPDGGAAERLEELAWRYDAMAERDDLRSLTLERVGGGWQVRTVIKSWRIDPVAANLLPAGMSGGERVA